MTVNVTSVNPVNGPPIMSVSTITLTGAIQQTPFSISYNTLLAKSQATDPSNHAIEFFINQRTTQQAASGTLTITKSGGSTATAIVYYTGENAATATVVATGDVLNFTPALGLTGVKNTFTLTAYNGNRTSTTSLNVNINIQPFGAQFNLTGVWATVTGLASITQTGATVSVIDQNKMSASGAFISFNQIRVTGSRFGIRTGTVDTTTADDGRIVWFDGTVWLRIALGGQWVVNGGGFHNTLASISQNGSALTFAVGAQVSSGSLLSQNLVRTNNFANAIGIINGSTISFINGQIWRKLDLPPTYTSSRGGNAAQIVQNGTNTLTLIDSLGQSTTAHFTDPTHLLAGDAKGVGTISNGTITWANGEIWSAVLTITGMKNGAGSGTITATSTGLTLSDGINTFQAKLTDANTIVVTVGTRAMPVGLIGRRKNGSIIWSNGVVWNNFDFNALDALFSMKTKYP